MKTKMLSKKIGYWAGVIVIGTVLGLALQFAKAWTEPTVAPPNENVGAPINIGNIGQTKDGGIGTNSSFYASKFIVAGTGDPKLFGDIAGTRLCIGSDCRDRWPDGGTSVTNPPCVEWTYAASWDICKIDGTQTRQVVDRFPDNCIGDPPINQVERACTPTYNCSPAQRGTISAYYGDFADQWYYYDLEDRYSGVCNSEGGTITLPFGGQTVTLPNCKKDPDKCMMDGFTCTQINSMLSTCDGKNNTTGKTICTYYDVYLNYIVTGYNGVGDGSLFTEPIWSISSSSAVPHYQQCNYVAK